MSDDQRRPIQRDDDQSVLLIEHCNQYTMKQYMVTCLDILNHSLTLSVDDYEDDNEYTGYMDRVSSVYGLLFSTFTR